LTLSIFAGVAMAVFGLVHWQNGLVALMFGSFAYSSYVTLQNYRGRNPW
jgi:hypothetical protein